MIGIYGGTFDPVHYGHLRTALEVKIAFSLDKLHLIPCAQPAHKETPVTTAPSRLEMLQIAVQGKPGLFIDSRELDRGGVSYMIDTLKSIRREIKENTPLLLFIGTDAFKGLASWCQWQSLFDYAHIIVMTRPGYEQYQPLHHFLASKLTKNSEQLKQKKSGHLFFQTVTQLDISSSKIRELTKAELSPGFLLPDSVIDYIKQKKLYQ